MSTEEKLAPEIQELLDNTPVLTDDAIQELAETNRALNKDPEHVAGIIKSVFVNDILCAMEEQGINKNQLAQKWGKSRQYIGDLLDKENARNFTIDTIVSLSMTLGLCPQSIQLKPMGKEFDHLCSQPKSIDLPPQSRVAESPAQSYSADHAPNSNNNKQ
jgi:plasmid maintenance system antidote protein VapI